MRAWDLSNAIYPPSRSQEACITSFSTATSHALGTVPASVGRYCIAREYQESGCSRAGWWAVGVRGVRGDRCRAGRQCATSPRSCRGCRLVDMHVSMRAHRPAPPQAPRPPCDTPGDGAASVQGTQGNRVAGGLGVARHEPLECRRRLRGSRSGWVQCQMPYALCACVDLIPSIKLCSVAVRSTTKRDKQLLSEALRTATHCGDLPLAGPPVVINEELALTVKLRLKEQPAVPGGEAQTWQGATGGGSALITEGGASEGLLLHVDVVFEDATFGRPANAPEKSNPFQGPAGKAARCAVSWHCALCRSVACLSTNQPSDAL
jgi:hypothetical protein